MISLLKEIIRMSSCIGDAPGLKVQTVDNNIELSAVDPQTKNLVFYAFPKEHLPEMIGTYAIPQLKTLDSMLSHEPYRAVAPEVERFTRLIPNIGEMEVPKQILFRDKKGGKSVFVFSIGADILGSAWPKLAMDIDFEPEKDAIKEFTKMAAIYSSLDNKKVQVELSGGNLKMNFGIEGSTTHYGNMIFAEGIVGTLGPGLAWDAPSITAILKTIGDRPMKLGMSNRKILRFVTDTELARYEYWLRCVQA